MNNKLTDYAKYRGKCKEFSEQLIADDSTLTLTRGYYHCPLEGKQQHWWCTRQDGTILDPTKDQFLSKGIGEYEVFDGTLKCEECGKTILEEEAIPMGRYGVCSSQCAKRLVGLA